MRITYQQFAASHHSQETKWSREHANEPPQVIAKQQLGTR
jgi:hypothetical protein